MYIPCDKCGKLLSWNEDEQLWLDLSEEAVCSVDFSPHEPIIDEDE